MSDRKLIIRACPLYEFQLGTSASSASCKLCKAFGEGAVSERTARNWFQKFRSGNATLEDEPRAGRSIPLNQRFSKVSHLAPQRGICKLKGGKIVKGGIVEECE